MIDSNNIDVIRTNIRTLNEKVLESNGDIATIIEDISDLEDDIESIENTIGSTPLPEGKTLANSIIKEITLTATTNESGFCTLVGCSPNKTINAIVTSPIRCYCNLYKGSDSAENISAVVRTRDGNALASTEILFKTYLINS